MEGHRPPNGRRASVVIVGGGISGLATAHYLEALSAKTADASPPIDLQVLEAAERPGGTIQSERIDGFLCEWGPNGFLDREPATLELCATLGLSEQLKPASDAFRNRYIYRGGRLRAVSMHPLKFLASGLLPWGAKLRLLREPWIKPPAEPPEDESVMDFASRRIGKRAAELLIDPMQSGIYAGDPARLSVASCFPRVVEVERQYRSLIRGMVRIARERKRERAALNGPGEASTEARSSPGAGPSGHLTSFDGGMQVLTDALAAKLGPRLRCHSRVVELSTSASGGISLRLADGQSVDADIAILACPAFVAAPLLACIDSSLSEEVAAIEYAPLAVTCLGYPRDHVTHPLDGFGFLAPRGEGMRLLGTLWSSAIFPGRAAEGQVLLRAMVGGARDPKVLERDDDAIVSDTHAELQALLGLPAAPTFRRVFRHPRAIPQYNVGHGARLARIDERLHSHPALVLTGNALRGIGVNDCVKNAIATAELVAQRLTQR